MKLLISLILSVISTAVLAQSFAPDRISEVNEKKKIEESIFVKGVVKELDEELIEISDNSGSIKVNVSSLESPKFLLGDQITIRGKLKLSDNDEKYVEATYFRKHKYVKDPSHCCMPEF